MVGNLGPDLVETAARDAGNDDVETFVDPRQNLFARVFWNAEFVEVSIKRAVADGVDRLRA